MPYRGKAKWFQTALFICPVAMELVELFIVSYLSKECGWHLCWINYSWNTFFFITQLAPQNAGTSGHLLSKSFSSEPEKKSTWETSFSWSRDLGVNLEPVGACFMPFCATHFLGDSGQVSAVRKTQDCEPVRDCSSDVYIITRDGWDTPLRVTFQFTRMISPELNPTFFLAHLQIIFHVINLRFAFIQWL